MQFRDLTKQYETLKAEIDQELKKVIDSAAFIMGKQVKELETRLAEYVGVKHCLSCANGTDALTLALKVWNIKSGDAVFVPDFTFFASAEAVSAEGATPVFVDVDKETFTIDVHDLEKKIQATIAQGKLTPRVIIAVDLFGLPANFPIIRNIADTYGLLVLEDGAQGFGGSINGQKACSFGDISTTSFFPAKPLGCYGDGGALFTDNDEWAYLIDSYRVHGKGAFKYDNVRIGMNSRLDTLQAAILLPKFKAFKNYELEKINNIADRYTQKLKDIVTTPLIPFGYQSSWAQYTLLFENHQQRDTLQAHLKERGIPTMVYYPKPMHQQTVYAEQGCPQNDCPISEMLCKCVLSLPMHPYLTEEEVDTVCKEIRDIITKEVR